jgi:hypothetical protein
MKTGNAARRLLRLYPRAWRDRYGEEFLATVGEESLRLQQVIDIVSGAIDAWLSADVRNAVRLTSTAPNRGGGTMSIKTMICGQAYTRYTTRDAMIGAAITLGGTFILALSSNAAKSEGWTVLGETLAGLGFLGPLTLSMPFWIMKGQPRTAQAATVGVTFAVLLALAFMSAG